MHHESQDHTVIIRVFRAENLQVGSRSCHELYLVSHQRWIGACSSSMPKMQQNDEVPVAEYWGFKSQAGNSLVLPISHIVLSC